MLNQVVLVGRQTATPEVKKGESSSYCNITLAVPRAFKNAEGVYETDFINVTTFGAVAENTCEYVQKGDIIGIKGRLQTDTYTTESGEKRTKMVVIAEKVTFLSSKKSSEEE